jgi:hypothetical protein
VAIFFRFLFFPHPIDALPFPAQRLPLLYTPSTRTILASFLVLGKRTYADYQSPCRLVNLSRSSGDRRSS